MKDVLYALQEAKKALEFYAHGSMTASTWGRKANTWELELKEVFEELEDDCEHVCEHYDGHETYVKGSRHASSALEIINGVLDNV